jgi:hypothetical protein
MNQKYMVKKNPDQHKVVRIDFIQKHDYCGKSLMV